MMSGYFILIIGVTFLGGAITVLSPKGYEKHLRLLCALCVLSIVMVPMFSFIADGSNSIENLAKLFSGEEYQKEVYEEIYNKSLVESEKENAEEILKNGIKQALSIKSDSFDVNIVLAENSDGFYITSVEVIIGVSDVGIDPRSVEKYINETLGCECEIIYDF